MFIFLIDTYISKKVVIIDFIKYVSFIKKVYNKLRLLNNIKVYVTSIK